MKTNELHKLLDGPSRPHLIHVLPEDVFEACHIPGSVNSCIYMVAFDDIVRGLIDDNDSSIIVYSTDDQGLEAKIAAERLAALGYRNVDVLEGGLAAWTAEGHPVEGAGIESRPSPHGIYEVDTGASVLRWTGRNLFNHHEGTLRLSAGRIELHEGTLVSAAFEIDMLSITCSDIADDSMRTVLIQHLMHSDFFDVENYPVARFDVTSAAKIEDATEGTPNMAMEGNFTLRGITHPLRFPAVVAFQPDGSALTAQAVLDVDRTRFGSIYGSGRFFRMLGPHLVNDHFHIHLKIRAVSCQS